MWGEDLSEVTVQRKFVLDLDLVDSLALPRDLWRVWGPTWAAAVRPSVPRGPDAAAMWARAWQVWRWP